VSEQEDKTLPDQDQDADVGKGQADNAAKSSSKTDKQDITVDTGKTDSKSDDSGKTITEPVVPEKYEFKVPAGVDLNANLVKNFSSFAREHQLTQEDAQKVIDMQVEAHQSLLKTVENETNRIRKEMKQRITDDPVMGKPENMALANKAFDGYSSKMSDADRKEFREWLDNGPGDYKPLMEFLHYIGKDISDDILVLGTDAKKSKDRGEKQMKDMYPTSFK